MVAAKSLNLKPADIQVTPGEAVKLGQLRIGTDGYARMMTFFYQDKTPGQSAFAVDSFFDVKSGKIPLDKYRDKIVLIGATAAGAASVMGRGEEVGFPIGTILEFRLDRPVSLPRR